jgi:hypothetical protein
MRTPGDSPRPNMSSTRPRACAAVPCAAYALAAALYAAASSVRPLLCSSSHSSRATHDVRARASVRSSRTRPLRRARWGRRSGASVRTGQARSARGGKGAHAMRSVYADAGSCAPALCCARNSATARSGLRAARSERTSALTAATERLKPGCGAHTAVKPGGRGIKARGGAQHTVAVGCQQHALRVAHARLLAQRHNQLRARGASGRLALAHWQCLQQCHRTVQLLAPHGPQKRTAGPDRRRGIRCRRLTTGRRGLRGPRRVRGRTQALHTCARWRRVCGGTAAPRAHRRRQHRRRARRTASHRRRMLDARPAACACGGLA